MSSSAPKALIIRTISPQSSVIWRPRYKSQSFLTCIVFISWFNIDKCNLDLLRKKLNWKNHQDSSSICGSFNYTTLFSKVTSDIVSCSLWELKKISQKRNLISLFWLGFWIFYRTLRRIRGAVWALHN